MSDALAISAVVGLALVLAAVTGAAWSVYALLERAHAEELARRDDRIAALQHDVANRDAQLARTRNAAEAPLSAARLAGEAADLANAVGGDAGAAAADRLLLSEGGGRPNASPPAAPGRPAA